MVYPTTFFDILATQHKKLLGVIRKHTTWFSAACDVPECISKGPLRPSTDGAIGAALAAGWTCTNASDVNPKLTCSNCIKERLQNCRV